VGGLPANLINSKEFVDKLRFLVLRLRDDP